MNVNLWGPELWQVLHGVAALADEEPRARPGAAGVLRGLTELLPCIHCLRSYRGFFAEAEAAHGPAEGWFGSSGSGSSSRSGKEMVYALHCRVDDKLEGQRLDALLRTARAAAGGVSADAWDAVEAALRQHAPSALSGRPSLAVVLKRWALSEGKPFPPSAVWRALFAFVLLQDAAPDAAAGEERRRALVAWTRDLASVLWYTLEYGALAASLLTLTAALEAVGPGLTSRGGFTLVACAREGMLSAEAPPSAEDLAMLRLTEEAWLRPLWRIVRDNLPAGACGTYTCA